MILPPEKPLLKLGFLPLLDCAPLVVAREQGLFKDNGLEVVLSCESSWGSIRDKVATGLLDGAQMLAPMPLASSLGLGSPRVAMITAMVLSLNGNAITLEQGLYQQLYQQTGGSRDPLVLGQALKAYIEQTAPLTLATVYPYSCHHYQLHSWLIACGIDPQRDINLVATPPQKMLGQLRAGGIHGYCVGEPWNSLAEIEGGGRILTTGYQIWPDAIEKVFCVTQEWAERYPGSHQALIRSLIQACRWLADPDNHRAWRELLALPSYLDRFAAKLLQHNYPQPDNAGLIRQEFYHRNANQPLHAHGKWLLEQMRQAGQLSGIETGSVVPQVFRPDLYRAATRTL